RLLHQFEESGSVNCKNPITRKSATEDEENVFTIIGSVIQNPNVSQNLISKSTNITQSCISRIIKKHNFYPYKIQLCQELYGHDFENQTEFCMWVLDKVAENENTFHNNGLVNRHNFHYSSDTNPRPHRVMKNHNTFSDLTPLKFFLWGYIKGIVYHTLPTTSHDVKTSIRDAFKTVTPQMLSRLSSGFAKRINKCLEMDGQHFEHLL
ncbi:hypothetical protein D910_03614, partial [Dendroctonus ponderosae]